jgi:hypothetical protein
MTLVVARIQEDAVAVAGDLRATDPHGIRRGYPYAVLKTVLLSPYSTIAFAGDIDAGLQVVRAVAEGADSGHDLLLEVLVSSVGLSHRLVELLLVSSHPARITRVLGSDIQDNLANAWIGDADAFSAFQRYYHGTGTPLPWPEGYQARHEVVGRLARALGELVAAGDVPSVGEAAIAIGTDAESQLIYMPSVAVHMAPQVIPPDLDTLLRFGSAAQGGHAYSVLTPTGPGIGAVGLHFYQARLGLLYYPVRATDAFVYRDMSHDEFRRAVMRDFGIEIQGIVIG